MGTAAEVFEQPLAQASHKLTVTEFHRMGEAGILDEAFELSEGSLAPGCLPATAIALAELFG